MVLFHVAGHLGKAAFHVGEHLLAVLGSSPLLVPSEATRASHIGKVGVDGVATIPIGLILGLGHPAPDLDERIAQILVGAEPLDGRGHDLSQAHRASMAYREGAAGGLGNDACPGLGDLKADRSEALLNRLLALALVEGGVPEEEVCPENHGVPHGFEALLAELLVEIGAVVHPKLGGSLGLSDHLASAPSVFRTGGNPSGRSAAAVVGGGAGSDAVGLEVTVGGHLFPLEPSRAVLTARLLLLLQSFLLLGVHSHLEADRLCPDVLAAGVADAPPDFLLLNFDLSLSPVGEEAEDDHNHRDQSVIPHVLTLLARFGRLRSRLVLMSICS